MAEVSHNGYQRLDTDYVIFTAHYANRATEKMSFSFYLLSIMWFATIPIKRVKQYTDNTSTTRLTAINGIKWTS